MRHLFMRLTGSREIPLGGIGEAGDVPELLRHVADFYDDNPDALAELLSGSRPFTCAAPAVLRFDAGSSAR